MKHNYLIGLGGSGGKIIAQLYARLIKERGKDFASDVECIAIDTDQDELNDLAQLGVKKVCISGSGNVGQLYNVLGDDVAEWCPNTANEGNFFSSSVFNGASQCRLKSRLCLANFLKNKNNSLEQVLEDSLKVSPNGEQTEESPPIVLIASSIAGGTGSGIFIQTALYIKKFFREHNIQNVIIHGLFACPDLYKGVVNAQQLPSLYANAYAVIRELNAFNLICGSETTAAYGGKLDIDIEISTECEGNLFKKDSEGRYGDKPYDVMYFIDKVNYLSKILGGLEEYYTAMANMAYSHLYTDISGEVLSDESNEMEAHNIAPCAIYGSAGAASMVYPYEDILRYFANRSIKESFDSVWTVLDRMWMSYYNEKNATSFASGYSRYIPEPGERAERYIEDFLKSAKGGVVSGSELSFLLPMVERNNVSAVDALFSAIKAGAENFVRQDNRIKRAKSDCGIDNLNETEEDIISLIANSSSSDQNADMFSEINDIDRNLESYCKRCMTYVYDLAMSFSNKILCEDKTLWDAYDKSEIGIIEGLLYNRERNEWVHPVAARYLLYLFMNKLEKNIRKLISGIDTAADDVDDFYNYLVNEPVSEQRAALGTSDEESLSNAQILQKIFDKFLIGKGAAQRGVAEYFETLGEKIREIDGIFVNALQYFSFIKVRSRLANLINEYELFFDNIDEFVKKAGAATTASESMHDNSNGVVYVCASAEVKRKLYEDAGRNIDTQTGETASLISKSLFSTMRKNAAEKSRTPNKKVTLKEKTRSIENFFGEVSDIVTESAKSNTEIQGSLDKNIFGAMLYEYALLNPENAGDEENYSGDDKGAKNRIDQFIESKFTGLAKMAAPFLVYDSRDTYSGMFKSVDENGKTTEKRSVSNSYRYISHSPDVDISIRNLIGAAEGSSGAVKDFYTERSAALPKDTESQTIAINYVKSDNVDPYTILCYSTVHCLQPYQINAFDEIKGGVYFEHYSKRISDMASVQRYSMTPHLDKRWHKHGVMPYINVSKEIERRYDLAKAFIYALCYGNIGYHVEGSDAKIVFGDVKLDRPVEIIFYKGKSIPYNRINKAMNWFADQEDLIERYSARFDELIEKEIDDLSKYNDYIGKYKTGITNHAKILNQLKRNVIRAIEITDAGNGKTKKLKEKKKISILELAWKLHVSEENEIDKDYAELLVGVLCEVIKKYAKAPYNADDIKEKREGSDAYKCYAEICGHIAASFLDEFAGVTKEKSKAASAKKSFGRDDSDIRDDESENGQNASANKPVSGNKGYEWANAVMKEALK